MDKWFAKSTCPHSLSIEWNLIRLGGHALETVTNTVHKTLPGGGGVDRGGIEN